MRNILCVLGLLLWAAPVASQTPTTIAWDLDATHASATAWEVETASNGVVACGSVQVLATERRCQATFSRTSAQTIRLRGINGSAIGDWSAGASAPAVPAGSPPGAYTIAFAAPIPPPTSYLLTVTRSGSGTVTSAPTGISCGSDCSEPYAIGAVVTLTRAAAVGWVFTGWGGACSGTAVTCQVTLSQDRSVSATFTQQTTMASFSDDFNRADSDSLGANWTEVAGDADILSNMFVLGSGGFTEVVAIYNTPTDTIEQYVKFTVGSVNFNFPTVILRYTNSSSPYYAFYFDNGAAASISWVAYPSVGGSSSDVQEVGGLSITSGDVVGLTISGTGTSTVVRVWKNPTGTPTSATDWGGSALLTLSNNPAVAADTGKSVGLGGAQSAANTCRFNDFFGGDIPGGAGSASVSPSVSPSASVSPSSSTSPSVSPSSSVSRSPSPSPSPSAGPVAPLMPLAPRPRFYLSRRIR